VHVWGIRTTVEVRGLVLRVRYAAASRIERGIAQGKPTIVCLIVCSIPLDWEDVSTQARI
jgi:hypothetical protein